MSRYRLVVDERERNVFSTLALEMKSAKDAKKGIDYEIKTISVGDYAVIDNRTEILIAIFERKTLENDFPASIKDGRYSNKEKMIAAREKTGCRLYYIVEGDLDPPMTKSFSGIPYRILESALFHLEVRDGFHIMRTKDINDTINKLMRFIYSLESIEPRAIIKSACADGISSIELVEGAEEPLGEDRTEEKRSGAMEVLTEKHEKKDIDILREMWSCFKGISVSSADMFLTRYSLKEIIRGEISRDVINNLKTPTGRVISRNVKAALNVVETPTCERMLSKVPGISTITAKELIKSAGGLHTMLSYEVAAISIMKIGAKKRNLGDKKAARIVELFNMKINIDKPPE